MALGIPLVIAFQLWVRRRPLRDLWVREGDAFRLDRRGRRIAALLVAYPLIATAIFLVQGQWLNGMMAACAVPGAFAAAYAVRRQDTRTWHPALRAALLATVIGLGWMVALIVPAMDADVSSAPGLVVRGLHSLLLYFPVAFVLEEVAFRGAVDAHVHHPGESWGWLSAVYVSVLWALWHIPIDIGSEPMTDLLIGLVLIHVSIGVPLSLAWRRSGNLVLPAAAHTVVDAVRQPSIASQIEARGIRDERVVEALRHVPRHLFVAPAARDEAYDDRPLPIGSGQTISQPYMVAIMTATLGVEPSDRVLEIGTGSGYQTAILARLAREVISIERHEALAERAAATMKELGITNVEIVTGDGSRGYAATQPYDRILVTAGAPAVPDSLKAQLSDGGRLVIPVGPGRFQHLILVERNGAAFTETEGEGCVFVPLIGAEGWPDWDSSV